MRRSALCSVLFCSVPVFRIVVFSLSMVCLVPCFPLCLFFLHPLAPCNPSVPYLGVRQSFLSSLVPLQTCMAISLTFWPLALEERPGEFLSMRHAFVRLFVLDPAGVVLLCNRLTTCIEWVRGWCIIYSNELGTIVQIVTTNSLLDYVLNPSQWVKKAFCYRLKYCRRGGGGAVRVW